MWPLGRFLGIALVAIAATGAVTLGAVRGGFPLGELERIRSVHQFYDRLQKDVGVASKPIALFLGNSVTIEGIDAGLYEQERDGTVQAFNLATTGATFEELALHVPYLKRIKPKQVLIMVHPESLETDKVEIHPRELILYKLLGFTQGEVPEALEPSDQEYLRSNLLAHILDGRFIFRSTIEDRIRFRLLSSLRRTDNEFKIPATYTVSLSTDQIQMILRRLNLRKGPFAPKPGHERNLRFVIRELKEQGIAVTVIAAPIHPLYVQERGKNAVEEFLDWLRNTTLDAGAQFLDASSLLDSSDFIDHFHPNGTGRATLSKFIANADRIGERIR